MLILASKSPRRAQLLTEAGFVFEQRTPPFDDPAQPVQPGTKHVDAHALAAQLAASKALSLARTDVFERSPGALLLAADTICVSDRGVLLGQPADAEEARQTIGAFVGNTHEVVTGVALLSKQDAQPEAWADAARVTLGRISEAQIEDYLKSEKWRGKAGGYNLFERQHAGWPLTVEGDPTTVVGLPMARLVGRLLERGETRAV